MNYIVTWWDGATKHHVVRKDEVFAKKTAQVLRTRSDGYTDRSLVPIRCMSQDVYERMQKMAKDDTKCRHGLLRLCMKCLTVS